MANHSKERTQAEAQLKKTQKAQRILSDSRTFLSQCSMSRLETRSIRVRRLARCGPGPI
jgi:hypothetical protein